MSVRFARIAPVALGDHPSDDRNLGQKNEAAAVAATSSRHRHAPRVMLGLRRNRAFARPPISLSPSAAGRSQAKSRAPAVEDATRRVGGSASVVCPSPDAHETPALYR